MNPINEYTKLYGEMGYLCDFEDDKWTIDFLKINHQVKRLSYINALDKFQMQHTRQSLIQELDSIIFHN